MGNNENRSLWDDLKEYTVVFGGSRLILLCVCVLALFTTAAIIEFTPENLTEMTAIEDYGCYTGTNNDTKVTEFINSFFPNKIEPFFSDVTYMYRATDYGSYACEAYLEATIEDSGMFWDYVASITEGMPCHSFRYDSDYTEYSLSDSMYLTIINEDIDADGRVGSVMITDAKVGKVLYSSKKQKIIFIAILVSSDSSVDTNYFCSFFERFSINPTEYTNKVDVIE